MISRTDVDYVRQCADRLAGSGDRMSADNLRNIADRLSVEVYRATPLGAELVEPWHGLAN